MNTKSSAVTMKDYNLSEKKSRIITIVIRMIISTAILIFALVKAKSGFTEDIDPGTNRSVKLMIISAVGADAVFCLGGLYSRYVFRAHYIMNILAVLTVFLLVAAVTGIAKALVIIPVLALPFLYYTWCSARGYLDTLKEMKKAAKKKAEQ